MRLVSATRSRLATWIVASFVALVLGCPIPGAAHEYWLSLTPGAALPGGTVQLGAFAGTGFRGEPKPFSPPRCVRLVAQVARTLDLARVAGSGELVWARFAPSDAGGAMFGYQSDFTPIELPAVQFDRYLALEGLDVPLSVRHRAHAMGPGRERYRRCAKTWLDGSDVTRATKPIGFSLEIVPLERPGAGAALRVRIVHEGRPLAAALVRAWRSPFDANGVPLDPAQRDSVDASWQGRSDARGEVTVPVTGTGEWLVSVVHMQACPEPAIADWESTWASLVFRRAPERSPR